MKNISKPIANFIVIVDCDGSVVDHLSYNCVIDESFELTRYLDNNFPDQAPHSIWRCPGPFEQVKD